MSATDGRFVVLRHEMPPESDGEVHWDFMLETEPGLRTWSLAHEPRSDRPIPARVLADHRKAYLDYEGPVSRNRGQVTRWDVGCYRVIASTENEWIVDLDGTRLRGTARLRARDSQSNQWEFTFQLSDLMR